MFQRVKKKVKYKKIEMNYKNVCILIYMEKLMKKYLEKIKKLNKNVVMKLINNLKKLRKTKEIRQKMKDHTNNGY